jgi:hypothetical protein
MRKPIERAGPSELVAGEAVDAPRCAAVAAVTASWLVACDAWSSIPVLPPQATLHACITFAAAGEVSATGLQVGQRVREFGSSHTQWLRGLTFVVWDGTTDKPNTSVWDTNTAPRETDWTLARRLVGGVLADHLSGAAHFRAFPQPACGVEVTAIFVGPAAEGFCGSRDAFCEYECTAAGCSIESPRS